ncbi:MAG: hypothetical protein M3355_06545 [Actinomycetota bacterium]|nr:hypothetical protein [Actinomycetota bacterium]
MLHRGGFSEPVVAAALLHDVVEDTSIDLDEICQGFGLEIRLAGVGTAIALTPVPPLDAR